MAVQPQLLASERHSFDVKIHCPGKINHFLHVLGRRDDGYHDLQTGFQFIEWGIGCIIETDEFRLTGMDHVACEDNLIWKARINWPVAQASSRTAIWRLKKSTRRCGHWRRKQQCCQHAAAIARAMALNISDRTLMQIGTALGADVPIFLYGTSAIGTGIGEQLEPLNGEKSQYNYFYPA